VCRKKKVTRVIKEGPAQETEAKNKLRKNTRKKKKKKKEETVHSKLLVNQRGERKGREEKERAGKKRPLKNQTKKEVEKKRKRVKELKNPVSRLNNC